ncbi:hypothetical protein SNOG_07508 [Parastagonospora nodorum SN15]|uniref:Uncharacterized protein n=1 Tax=Phaeosphaeria nodorum (strain SN15 / ATCC MYA-4574 / FGSC 10173) TaxID=321614 RepID=Q0UL56_PHANO|nr:hypothetical protein SNOG_07508 [Parastagonospora nodorum SN15]EAT84974.1 hypothetical protein SNOG_07508 [Parastagonospora nodorum SN15]
MDSFGQVHGTQFGPLVQSIMSIFTTVLVPADGYRHVPTHARPSPPRTGLTCPRR